MEKPAAAQVSGLAYFVFKSFFTYVSYYVCKYDFAIVVIRSFRRKIQPEKNRRLFQ